MVKVDRKTKRLDTGKTYFKNGDYIRKYPKSVDMMGTLL